MENVQPAPTQPSYRKVALFHWLNWAFLAAGGVAGAAIDPTIWLAMIPIEGAVLWILPDLPPFQLWADKKFTTSELMRERAYFLDRLWGLEPIPAPTGFKWFIGLFAERTDEKPLDDRIIRRTNPDSIRYLEMRATVKHLQELTTLRGSRITNHDINRFEQFVNGYLRLLFAARPLEKALRSEDERTIRREMSAIEDKAEGADSAVRAVLMERLRLLQSRLERLPRIQATLDLLKTRADALVYQLQNLHSQLLADPGVDVTAILEEMVERQEMIADPLGQLESDQMVRDFLSRANTHDDDAPSAGPRANSHQSESR